VKNLFVVVAMLAAVPALAGDKRISSELAVVKACEAGIRDVSLDLATVRDAFVSNLSDRALLEVTLLYGDATSDCESFSWFTYEGTRRACPDCDAGDPMCMCVIGWCTVKATGEKTLRYSSTR
jgi:hypothetical protein